MPAVRQTTNWSPQVHEDILIAILECSSLSKEQWASIMASLAEKNYSFTENALRYVEGVEVGVARVCLVGHQLACT